ncbi:MAG: cell division protein FtsA [Akkermansia sp.]|nr:cell division protein FtsA [Akkermansia sp.]
MPKTKILASLEIGTSKTCMVVGEIHPDATATIIGGGEVPSAGIRKGEIVDQNMARQCVCDAWQLAQDHAKVDILNVFLSVTGDHISGINNVGSYRLPDTEDIIDEEHMSYAREKAEHAELPSDHFTMHTETGGYSVDGDEPTRHPAGLTGHTLDVNSHIIHGISSRVKNSLVCVRGVPLEVEELVFAPLATAQMVLSRAQKESGALLIDIGGGTSDFICYKGTDIIASGCIPIGGVTINQDIMRLAEQPVSREAAEYLKCTEGDAFGDVKDRSLAQYRSQLGMHDVSIERGLLNRIIRDRLADALLRVRDRIPKEVLSQNGMALYLCGGTSMMRGLDSLARYIFGMPVNQPAQMTPEEGRYLNDPRYCTTIGLLRFAQRYDDDAMPGGGWLDSLFRRFRSHH